MSAPLRATDGPADYTVGTEHDALTAALLISGTSPAMIDEAGLAWQRRNARPQRLPSFSSGVIVGLDDGSGYDVREVRRGLIGRIVARIRLRGGA